jgi:hypothetical protein
MGTPVQANLDALKQAYVEANRVAHEKRMVARKADVAWVRAHEAAAAAQREADRLRLDRDNAEVDAGIAQSRASTCSAAGASSSPLNADRPSGG